MSDSQVLNKPAPPAAPIDGTFGGLILYLLLVLAPIGLKLAGLTRVATWSWWKVTALLWLPWSMLVVVSMLGWLDEQARLHQADPVQRRRLLTLRWLVLAELDRKHPQGFKPGMPLQNL